MHLGYTPVGAGVSSILAAFGSCSESRKHCYGLFPDIRTLKVEAATHCMPKKGSGVEPLIPRQATVELLKAQLLTRQRSERMEVVTRSCPMWRSTAEAEHESTCHFLGTACHPLGFGLPGRGFSGGAGSGLGAHLALGGWPSPLSCRFWRGQALEPRAPTACYAGRRCCCHSVPDSRDCGPFDERRVWCLGRWGLGSGVLKASPLSLAGALLLHDMTDPG